MHQQIKTGLVLGMHPMFGPSVKSLAGQKVILCPVRPGPLSERVTQELDRIGFELLETDPDTHDRMMAAVQVLVHFSTIVMAEALRRTSIPVRKTLEFTSPIYLLELAICGRLFAQDPDLYAQIEMENPHSQEVRRHFLEAAGTVNEIVSRGSVTQFRELFSSLSDYLEDFPAEAMDLSDGLIESLTRTRHA